MKCSFVDLWKELGRLGSVADHPASGAGHPGPAGLTMLAPQADQPNGMIKSLVTGDFELIRQ